MSRHSFSEATALSDLDDDRRFLTDRECFGFRQFSDNRTHLVRAGDTLQSVAARYYRGLPRPSGLWWVIADYQPQRVHDPTLELTEGSVLAIPSRRTVEREVFGEKRRLTG
jgi:hypothetical protein